VRLEELGQLKYSMTLSGIEPYPFLSRNNSVYELQKENGNLLSNQNSILSFWEFMFNSITESGDIQLKMSWRLLVPPGKYGHSRSCLHSRQDHSCPNNFQFVAEDYSPIKRSKTCGIGKCYGIKCIETNKLVP
jgi:hypothetical protein